MKQVLSVFFVFFVFVAGFSNSLQATDDLSVKSFIRFYSSSDFVTEQSKMDFEFSGLIINKKFGENLSITVIPAFGRKSLFIDVASTDDAGLKHDPLDVFIVGLNTNIKDVYAGVGLTVGMYVSPFYSIEEYYMPFRFIEKPVDYRMMSNNFSEMGLMLNKNFMDDSIKLHLGYISGVGFWNSEFFTSSLNDNKNAGGARFMLTVFPAKSSEILKELSFTFNLKAIARTSARSNYNFLLGYKYAKLSTSVEYLGTYSADAAKKMNVINLGAAYEVLPFLQPLVRYDYSDQNGAIENYILGGINTKWFEGKYQVAATFGVKDSPHSNATMKRFLLSTQAYF